MAILEGVYQSRYGRSSTTHAEDSCVSQDTMTIGWWLLFVVISQLLASCHADSHSRFAPGNIAERLYMFDIILYTFPRLLHYYVI